MQSLTTEPTSANYLRTLSQPIQHSPRMQALLEENRRVLLFSPMLSKPEEISGYLVESKDGPQLRLSIRNDEVDRKFKTPRAPITIEATFNEWREAFARTPRLLEKLTPMLRQVAPALLAPSQEPSQH